MSKLPSPKEMHEQNTKPYQECTSCGKKGHTYLACPTNSFWKAAGEAFGIKLPD